MLVQRIASGWWGEETGRRAVVLFCLFPGSVVFSMVYAEGMALALATGCILALQRRRWLLAGVLAGLATAVEPEAMVLVIVCAVSALIESRRRGWRVRGGASLLAPLLSVTGVRAFAIYLWAHAGTPFAYTEAQRYGWNEKADPFALVHLARALANRDLVLALQPSDDQPQPRGRAGRRPPADRVAGAAVRVLAKVSVEALVWTLGISFLAVTSEYTPPNPRLLITAFPAVIVPAYYVRGTGVRLVCADQRRPARGAERADVRGHDAQALAALRQQLDAHRRRIPERVVLARAYSRWRALERNSK